MLSPSISNDELGSDEDRARAELASIEMRLAATERALEALNKERDEYVQARALAASRLDAAVILRRSREGIPAKVALLRRVWADLGSKYGELREGRGSAMARRRKNLKKRLMQVTAELQRLCPHPYLIERMERPNVPAPTDVRECVICHKCEHRALLSHEPAAELRDMTGRVVIPVYPLEYGDRTEGFPSLPDVLTIEERFRSLMAFKTAKDR